ncbi:fumarylacetoacetate hydrolase family protein [Candidatus Margulisiibacteriota bacterium]
MNKKLVIGQNIGLIEEKERIDILPGKIIAVGLNYKDHARELKMHIPGEPIIFMKPNTAVIGHMDDIIYPKMSAHVDYEAELAVIIKEKAKNISEKEAKKYIFGYTCANDVTARDLQKKDGQWTRAKSFDTFCPLGPVVVDKINPDKLSIKMYLNGEVVQNSNTSNMIFNVSKIVSFISSVMTLLPGDVILTGTPAGIGKLKPGDMAEVEISGIGKLTNQVEARA